MTLASSSMVPARVKTAPWAALKRGLFSRRETVWVAMERAESVARECVAERRIESSAER
jgi:hypothetical protein